MHVRMRMAARTLAAMGVNLIAFFYRDCQETTISHAALGYHVFRDTLNIPTASFKNRHLQATVMIKVNMHCCQRRVVMLMERMDEPISQLSCGMIVNVNEGTDTILTVALYCLGEPRPRQVSDGLRTVLISVRRNNSINVCHEPIIDSDRDALHEPFLSVFGLPMFGRSNIPE